MKRLNPKTGKPFVWGEKREDGYVFSRYFPTRLKKDGYFLEQWISPEALKKIFNDAVMRHRKNRLTPEGRARILLVAARQRAKKAKGVMTLTWQEIAKKIEHGKCELTGLPFDLNTIEHQHTNPYAPSLDKIDPRNKNYTPENVRVVLAAVNVALGEYGTKDMLPIFEALVKAIRKENK